MDNQYKKYIYILVTIQVAIFAVITSFIIFISNNIASYNNEVFQMLVIKEKEKSMRERIDNIIVHINIQQKIALTQVEKTINLAVVALSNSDKETTYQNAQKILNEIYQSEYGAPVKMIIYNHKSNKAELFSNNHKIEEIIWEKDEKNNILFKYSKLYKSIIVGDYNIYFFADQSGVDKIVKNYIYNEIHSSKYADNEYIWVNEILNYEGGDNYAQRVIHPYLKHTEGAYLSTNMSDIKGNLPYLKELNGVKQNGEILHSYYFINKVNNQITQKLSYAKLFKPYNWIIATGEPMEDIFSYTNKLKEYYNIVIKKTVLLSFVFMTCIFIISILFMLKTQKHYRKKIETYVRTETELDALTGAYSRKTGVLKIEELFLNYQHLSSSPLLMMIDIDNFKKINDTYGHDVGDIVLKKISQTIQANIRECDFFFRWGGEEFILLFNPIDLNQQYKLAQKILCCVNSISFESSNNCFNVTVSIGGSCFNKEDTDYTQAIKRSDVALYQSKHSGKNKYTSSCEANREAPK